MPLTHEHTRAVPSIVKSKCWKEMFGLHEILHILGTAQQAGTGIAHLVSELARRVDRCNYRLSAWFLLEDGPLVEILREAGVDTRVIKWRPSPKDPLGCIRFWRSLRSRRFVIIHQHFGGPRVRWIARRACDAKILLHLHGRVSETANPIPVRLNTAYCDEVIAVSRAVADWADTPARVVCSGVGIDPMRAIRGESRSKKALVIGSAGRLIPLKCMDSIVRAFALVSHACPGARLEIAGHGPERSRIEAEIERLGLTNRVQLLGWSSNLREVMRGWDVYVQASLEEGLPISVLEAMAENLPVVATNVGGLAELVVDGETGLLVPPDDDKALAASILRILTHVGERRLLGAQGLKRAQEFFSADRFHNEITSVYSELAGQPAGDEPANIEMLPSVGRISK